MHPTTAEPQPHQTASKQGYNSSVQQTPVVQIIPQQAPQVVEEDSTPVKGMIDVIFMFL